MKKEATQALEAELEAKLATERRGLVQTITVHLACLVNNITVHLACLVNNITVHLTCLVNNITVHLACLVKNISVHLDVVFLDQNGRSSQNSLCRFNQNHYRRSSPNY